LLLPFKIHIVENKKLYIKCAEICLVQNEEHLNIQPFCYLK